MIIYVYLYIFAIAVSARSIACNWIDIGLPIGSHLFDLRLPRWWYDLFVLAQKQRHQQMRSDSDSKTCRA